MIVFSVNERFSYDYDECSFNMAYFYDWIWSDEAAYLIVSRASRAFL